MDAEYSREKKELVRLAYDFLHKQVAGYDDFYEYNYDNSNHTPVNLSIYGEERQAVIHNLHINFDDEVIVESQIEGDEYIDSDVLDYFSNDEIRDILKVCGII